ncbi:MAG: class A beta-lactamase-related serine hydrolase [Oscillospiraceae bacterium]|nr:class A beta-lactamase-related serine hydrolase [Oscillospiraceae bacterium]
MHRVHPAALGLALALALSLFVPSLADDETADNERFAGKSWAQVTYAFIEDYDIRTENIAIGYRNLVSGETYFLNGDNYITGASVYKLPLNMYCSNLVYQGEMEWDTLIGGYQYQIIEKSSIVSSNNEVSEALQKALGTYEEYRADIAPMLGVDTETVESEYFESNIFTPRQLIFCLTLLYNEPDIFPNVLDYMLIASPTRSFCTAKSEIPYDIAHKFGYLYIEETGHSYVNDAGIIFTDEPFALVFLSDNGRVSEGTLGKYCALMTEYTQYQTEHRAEEEPVAAEEPVAIETVSAAAEVAAEPERTAAPQPAESEDVSPTEAAEEVEETENTGEEPRSAPRVLIILVALGVVVILAVLLALRGKKRTVSEPTKHLAESQGDIMRCKHPIPAAALCALALLAALTAVLLCRFGGGAPVLLRQSGESAETAVSFLDALCGGDYDAAGALLAGDSTLGLQTLPDSDEGAALWSLLTESWSYTLCGGCEQDGTTATQEVEFTSLDLSAMLEGLDEDITAALAERVENAALSSDIYDENGDYREEIVMQVYSEALAARCAAAEGSCVTRSLTLTLTYTDGAWRVVADEALVNALFGSIAG